jgi:T-complex protein 1 subunit beta
LDEGFILEKKISIASMKVKENPKILLANCPMDYDKIKIYGSTVKSDSLDKVAEIEAAEKKKMADKVNKIVAHKCDVFINRQLIYDYPDQLMAEKGVMVIEHADFDGTERLAAVLGADIVSTFDNPDKVRMGTCKKIEEIMIGEEKVIKFSGCARNEACTIVLRGSGNHVLDEAERSLHDALCVLSQIVSTHKVIYGGGNSEMQMAIAIEEEAKKVSSKEAFAMNSFATALKQIPSIIADNAGLDSADLSQRLQSELMKGNKEAGIDVYKATIGSMKEMGITESLRVKEHALKSAMEAAEMILRVDQTIQCAKRKREDPRDRMFG